MPSSTIRYTSDARPVVRAISAANLGLHVDRPRPLRADVRDDLHGDRLVAQIASAFGLLDLAVTAIGLFGVVSAGLTSRTREFGLRMALGATGADVIRLVLRPVAWLR